MELLLFILAFVLLAAGILGVFIPIIPGTPLSYMGLLVLQWSGYGNFSFVFLLVWALITAAITIMDFFLPSIMTKRFGGSRAASVGSFLGLIIGLFFLPLGIILGPFLGALAGELIYQNTRQNTNSAKAFKAALGASLAFFIGSGVKLIVCGIMLLYAIGAVF